MKNGTKDRRNIFEFGGEWYQGVKNPYNECTDCDFCFEIGRACVRKVVGQCSMSNRSDCLSVVFKKLEKAGGPYEFGMHLFQSYSTFEIPIFTENYATVRELGNNSKISIEIKQNKEDMEENKLNLKPFDIQKAREGKPVCTRDGRKARIICFDKIDIKSIIALVLNYENKEVLYHYYDNGRSLIGTYSNDDLTMLPEKKEGWVNIVSGSNGSPHMGRGIFQSKEEAENDIKAFSDNLIDTVKISWDE